VDQYAATISGSVWPHIDSGPLREANNPAEKRGAGRTETDAQRQRGKPGVEPGILWRLPMATQDIRWIQRFNNFDKALSQLTRFIEKGELNEMERQGLIQSFEYNYELAWNTLKDYFEAQGETNIFGSRDAFRLAFKRGLIENGETWMQMIISRILTNHTYNEDTAEKIAKDTETIYYKEFVKLRAKLEALKQEEE
jgi:nucleotidyltransferase substrate binding protein (TIGR01987 family)